MDDIVKQALAKWPNVPNCYGWLGLDTRGNWFMRDDQTQALGPFVSTNPISKGSLLRHNKLIDFIERNYESDPQGQWFFQNGPQRVYVELAATPFIWRVKDDFSVTDHLGRPARVQRCLLDELGHLYLDTDSGFGLIHSMDMGDAASAIEEGLWAPQDVLSKDLPERFRYVMSPQALQKGRALQT